MPAGSGTPDLVRHCVAAVAKQYGGDTDKAFAICVAQLQKNGYLEKGSMKLTAAGKKKEKEHENEPDAGKKLKAYEKLLKAARKEESDDFEARFFEGKTDGKVTVNVGGVDFVLLVTQTQKNSKVGRNAPAQVGKWFTYVEVVKGSSSSWAFIASADSKADALNKGIAVLEKDSKSSRPTPYLSQIEASMETTRHLSEAQTRFRKGQRVKSVVNAQGLKNGASYEVVDTDEVKTPFGTYVSYKVQGADKKEMWITNGHLVLSPEAEESAPFEWENDLYGKKLPKGFKEKAVTVTIKKIGKSYSSSNIEFHIADRVYDEYLKDYLASFAPEDEEAFDILLKSGMSEDEINSMLDQIHATKKPVELDTPIKVKTTVLVRIPYGEDTDAPYIESADGWSADFYHRLINPTENTGLEDAPRTVARRWDAVRAEESSMDLMRRLSGISDRFHDRKVSKY